MGSQENEKRECSSFRNLIDFDLKEPYERQPPKKILHVNETSIFNFFVAKDSNKKNDMQ